MLEFLTGKASKGFFLSETEISETMDKYAQIKRFNYDFQLQVYMYYFMYVDPETIAEEDYFPYNKTFV